MSRSLIDRATWPFEILLIEKKTALSSPPTPGWSRLMVNSQKVIVKGAGGNHFRTLPFTAPIKGERVLHMLFVSARQLDSMRLLLSLLVIALVLDIRPAARISYTYTSTQHVPYVGRLMEHKCSFFLMTDHGRFL